MGRQGRLHRDQSEGVIEPRRPSVSRHQTPRFAGAFSFAALPLQGITASDAMDIGRQPTAGDDRLRRLDRADQLVRAKRLLQATTSASSGDCGDESRASSFPISRRPADPECARASCVMRSKPLVPCRKISTIARSKLRVFELLQSGRAAGGFDDLEMMDPQHDGDHRADIGLVVNDENAGHRRTPGSASASLHRNLGFRAEALPALFRRVSKDAVTLIECLPAPRLG